MKADIWSPNAVRASIGTIFSLPIALAPAGKAITWLKRHGVSIVAATPGAETLYTDVDLAAATALVLGSEDQGAGPAWLTAADVAVRIPMRGKGDSLNVSAAATILLYEALRQREKSRE
jgi:TrmH family RNA methyltransferase